MNKTIFIEPSSEHYFEDRLFDIENKYLNRDGTLLPFFRLRKALQNIGFNVHTADYLRLGKFVSPKNYYWSLGMTRYLDQVAAQDNIIMQGFILLEPPLVSPKEYINLDNISTLFEEVYLHNVDGDGYSLEGLDRKKLHKLNWPQPYDMVVEPYWANLDRSTKLVVVAGNHNPGFRKPEFYSLRIKMVAELASQDSVDLYGRGWDKWFSRNSAWIPYWKNKALLMRAYRGACDSKIDILSQYKYSLCLENMPMNGYITEKIFDCFYAGSVPIYLGAIDVNEYIPHDCYIDLRGYEDTKDLLKYLNSISFESWKKMRDCGRDFIAGNGKNLYHDSLLNIFQCNK